MPIYPPTWHDFRETGQGTVNNPRIIWLIPPPSRLYGRIKGCEDIARECAWLYGFTYVWMRAADHSTTRGKIGGLPVLLDTDPHITVYFGMEDSVATHQADVFLVYDSGRIPRRMALPQEMVVHLGSNPAMGPA